MIPWGYKYSLSILRRDLNTGYWQAFLNLYMEIVEKGTDPVQKVLVHIRDHPDEPCLIHCTGMKLSGFIIWIGDLMNDSRKG